jgi:hypothetical protein
MTDVAKTLARSQALRSEFERLQREAQEVRGEVTAMLEHLAEQSAERHHIAETLRGAKKR